MIAEYLKIKCPLCDGVGHKERGLFSDPSQMRMGSCHACKGTGKIWALTIEEMAERTSQAESRVRELEAAIKRLTTGRAFVIKYDDADVEDEVFVGEGAEEGALYRYAQASQSWNCHLFIEVVVRAAELKTEKPPQS